MDTTRNLNTLPISQQAVIDDVKARAAQNPAVKLISEHQHVARPIDFKKGTFAPGNFVHHLTYDQAGRQVIFNVYPCGTLGRVSS
jgi:hypothetical protein